MNEAEGGSSGPRMRTARRVSFWTTNLIASGFVVIVALVLGRELVGWWRPSDVPLDETISSSDSNGTDVEILFGDTAQALRRRTHQGDAASALDALQEMCRDDADQLCQSARQLPPPGPHEQRLLSRLAGQMPAESAPNGIDLYRWEAGFPMVVATATIAGKNGSAALGKSPSEDGEMSSRVVTWGLAIPYGENAWRLMSLRPRFSSETNSTVDLATAVCPPDATHVMTVRQPDQSRISVYFAEKVDRSLIDRWTSHFDGRFEQEAASWLQTQNRWMKSYPSVNHQTAVSVSIEFDATSSEARVVVVTPNAMED